MADNNQHVDDYYQVYLLSVDEVDAGQYIEVDEGVEVIADDDEYES